MRRATPEYRFSLVRPTEPQFTRFKIEAPWIITKNEGEVTRGGLGNSMVGLDRIPYDLVLMDCQMPVMDGYEATAEIRRREGSVRQTPIVAMTAHALDSDRAKCIEAGMDEYVSKPVKPEELGEILERLLAAPINSDGTNLRRTAESSTRRSLIVQPNQSGFERITDKPSSIVNVKTF